MVTNDRVTPCLGVNNTSLCVYHCFSIHLPVHGHPDLPHVLAVVEVQNVGIHTSLQDADFTSYKSITSRKTAGSPWFCF